MSYIGIDKNNYNFLLNWGWILTITKLGLNYTKHSFVCFKYALTLSLKKKNLSYIYQPQHNYEDFCMENLIFMVEMFDPNFDNDKEWPFANFKSTCRCFFLKKKSLACESITLWAWTLAQRREEEQRWEGVTSKRLLYILIFKIWVKWYDHEIWVIRTKIS